MILAALEVSAWTAIGPLFVALLAAVTGFLKLRSETESTAVRTTLEVMEELRGERTEARKESAELRAQLHESWEETAHLQRQLAEMRTQVNGLHGQIDVLEAEVNAMRSKAGELRRGMK